MKKDLRCFLNENLDGFDLISSGIEFHNLGPEKQILNFP